MSTMLTAHYQWANRPADERFWNEREMLEAMLDLKLRSSERETHLGSVQAVARTFPGYDSPDLCITGKDTNGTAITLTNWSAGQLCRMVGAPAEYMSRLPAPLAAECLNHTMRAKGDPNLAMLIHRNREDKSLTLRAVTSDKYARLWNADALAPLRVARDAGWMVPPGRPANGDDPRARKATAADIVPGQDAMGLAVKVGDLIAPCGAYAGDRDMFLFMVQPNRVVDLDGDSLMRGFILSNSEVGAAAFRLTTFLLEGVCGNHIIHGTKHLRNFRLIHKGAAMRSFGHKLATNLRQLTDASMGDERDMVAAARSHVLGKNKEEVIEATYKLVSLSQTTITAGYEAAVQFEHTAKATPNTTWSLCHGLTRISQASRNMDARMKIDEEAGKLLDIAATARRELVPVRG